jgi:hypothetical protein
MKRLALVAFGVVAPNVTTVLSRDPRIDGTTVPSGQVLALPLSCRWGGLADRD